MLRRYLIKALLLWLTSLSGLNQAGAQVAAIPKFTFLEWNIEAGGSDVATILEQLKQLEPFDLLALSEVPAAAMDQFAQRWSDDSAIAGTSGGMARMLVAWNPQVFEKVKAEEIKQVGATEFAPGLQMAPLLVQLRHIGSGQEFVLVMTHLARGSAELRKKQALLLSELAKAQKLPVVAMGGFNFDYDFVKHRGNEAFDAFLQDDTWKWIKPKEWVDSNWADRNRDGIDDYPDSMLDFVFVTGAAKHWPMQCEIVVREGDFPDTDKTSDHRPVKCAVGL